MARPRTGKQPQWRAILKYQRHRALCKYRGIPFNFTFEEWNQWWLDNGVDKNQDTKWVGRERLCMSRYNDQGAYELGNVYLIEIGESVREHHERGHWKPKRKTYIYNGEPMTIVELREHIGTRMDAKFFHKDHIDKFKQVEFKKLKNKYDRLPKVVKFPKFWEGHKDKWHTSEKAAYTELGITKGRYQYLTDQGQKRRRQDVGLTLEQYIRANSRYPDPLLP